METSKRDYYEILGVPKNADAKVIKNAFRELAMKFHPDRNKSPDAESKFKDIAEAYAVLSDPKKKSEYDSRGFAGVSDYSQEDIFKNVNFQDIFSDLGVGFKFNFGGAGQDIFGIRNSGFSDEQIDSEPVNDNNNTNNEDGFVTGRSNFFDRLFRRKRKKDQRGESLEIDFKVPLQRIETGGKENIEIDREILCTQCNGSRTENNQKIVKCSFCDGSGKRVVSHKLNQQKNDSFVKIESVQLCEYCNGSGQLNLYPCKNCHGRGVEQKKEILEIEIPKGAPEGLVLRIPNKGKVAKDLKSDSGDLYIYLSTLPDSKFERDGQDLWCTEKIEVCDAIVGAQLIISTLCGSVDLKIAPGTQPNSILRLKNKGLPGFQGEKRGDLFIRVQIHIPEKLTKEEFQLYEKLKSISNLNSTSTSHSNDFIN